jgi:hypothetical protein
MTPQSAWLLGVWGDGRSERWVGRVDKEAIGQEQTMEGYTAFGVECRGGSAASAFLGLSLGLTPNSIL